MGETPYKRSVNKQTKFLQVHEMLRENLVSPTTKSHQKMFGDSKKRKMHLYNFFGPKEKVWNLAIVFEGTHKGSLFADWMGCLLCIPLAGGWQN